MDGDDIGILLGLGLAGLILYLSAQNALIPKLEQIWIWIATIGSGSSGPSKKQVQQMLRVDTGTNSQTVNEVGAGVQEFMFENGIPGTLAVPIGAEQELKKLGF